MQSLLDVVCFCDFRQSDVKSHSIDATTTLVKLMQLMIEYLLHCQDCQLQLIQTMKAQQKNNKKNISEMQSKISSQKEDIRIYQRQVTQMKKSLINSDTSKVEYGHKIISSVDDWNKENGSNRNEASNTSTPDIGRILKHEQDTREYIRAVLDEQRNAFLVELRENGESYRSLNSIKSQASSQLEQEMHHRFDNLKEDVLSAVKLLGAQVNSMTSVKQAEPVITASGSAASNMALLIARENDLSRREELLRQERINIQNSQTENFCEQTKVESIAEIRKTRVKQVAVESSVDHQVELEKEQNRNVQLNNQKIMAIRLLASKYRQSEFFIILFERTLITFFEFRITAFDNVLFS